MKEEVDDVGLDQAVVAAFASGVGSAQVENDPDDGSSISAHLFRGQRIFPKTD